MRLMNVLAAVGALATAGGVGLIQGLGDQPDQTQPAQTQSAPGQPAQNQPSDAPAPNTRAATPANAGTGFAAQLVAGLKSVDGCLGVDMGQFQSGKNTIVAWFRDAQAARAWYNHPTHRSMIKMVGADPEAKKPLEHVKDGVPVMVIASITFSDGPKIEGIPMPISQIAIELYTPLPGGASINGRLSPEEFKIEHHNVIKP